MGQDRGLISPGSPETGSPYSLIKLSGESRHEMIETVNEYAFFSRTGSIFTTTVYGPILTQDQEDKIVKDNEGKETFMGIHATAVLFDGDEPLTGTHCILAHKDGVNEVFGPVPKERASKEKEFFANLGWTTKIAKIHSFKKMVCKGCGEYPYSCYCVAR